MGYFDKGCPDGASCYAYGSGTYNCITTGTRQPGQPCGTAGDCIRGYACIDVGVEYRCLLVCDDTNYNLPEGCASPGTCEAGTCQPAAGYGFKVCR